MPSTSCPCGVRARFPNEAALVDVLADADVSVWANADSVVLAEFAAPRRRPDLLAVAVDAAEAARRSRLGVAALDDAPAALRVAAVLARREAEVTSAELGDVAREAGFSRSHVVASCLPELVERGWVERMSRTRWRATNPWRSPAAHLVSVEAKLALNRTAVHQALSHLLWADAAWIAVDADRYRPWKGPESLRAFGVLGVCAACGQVTVLDRPAAAREPTYLRDQAAEHAYARVTSGRLGGEEHLVFGRVLDASGTARRIVGTKTPDGHVWDRRTGTRTPVMHRRDGTYAAVQDPATGRWVPGPRLH